MTNAPVGKLSLLRNDGSAFLTDDTGHVASSSHEFEWTLAESDTRKV